MDLRPTLARKFATAIYDNMIGRGLSDAPDVRDPIIEEWVDLIVERFVSHSVPHLYCGDTDEEGITLFRSKYPDLEPVIEAVKGAARSLFPRPGFSYELHSDPEGCHTCHEGQHITMLVHTGHGQPEDSDAWAERACDSTERLDDITLEDGFPRHPLLLTECRPGTLAQYEEGLRQWEEERRQRAEEHKARARREAGE